MGQVNAESVISLAVDLILVLVIIVPIGVLLIKNVNCQKSENYNSPKISILFRAVCSMISGIYIIESISITTNGIFRIFYEHSLYIGLCVVVLHAINSWSISMLFLARLYVSFQDTKYQYSNRLFIIISALSVLVVLLALFGMILWYTDLSPERENIYFSMVIMATVLYIVIVTWEVFLFINTAYKYVTQATIMTNNERRKSHTWSRESTVSKTSNEKNTSHSYINARENGKLLSMNGSKSDSDKPDKDDTTPITNKNDNNNGPNNNNNNNNNNANDKNKTNNQFSNNEHLPCGSRSRSTSQNMDTDLATPAGAAGSAVSPGVDSTAIDMNNINPSNDSNNDKNENNKDSKDTTKHTSKERKDTGKDNSKDGDKDDGRSILKRVSSKMRNNDKNVESDEDITVHEREMLLIDLITKFSILIVIADVSTFVVVAWTALDTLLTVPQIGYTIMMIDIFCSLFCVYLQFGFANDFYQKICSKCHKKVQNCVKGSSIKNVRMKSIELEIQQSKKSIQKQNGKSPQTPQTASNQIQDK